MAASPADKSVMPKAMAIAACLVFAVFALGNGADRRAFLRPSTATKVPAFFADTALLTRGQADLAAGRSQAALVAGEAAVRRSPIDPVSPALLGAARLALGDRQGADKAFRVAGQMGWRVPLTQAYWMSRAITVRDWRVAAERFDALLRQQPSFAENAQLLATMESSEEGRLAIVERLAKARSPWLEAYARGIQGQPEEVIGRRTLVLHEIARKGLILGCDPISLPVIGLARLGRVGEAQSLWREHCPEAGAQLVADGNFVNVRTTGARSSFEWELVGNSDVGIAIIAGGSAAKRLIAMESSASQPRIVLRQQLIIAPGTYRLGWQESTVQGQLSSRIKASLECAADGATWLEAKPTQAHAMQHQADLNVDAQCSARWLVFTLIPGPGEVRLGAVNLEKI